MKSKETAAKDGVAPAPGAITRQTTDSSTESPIQGQTAPSLDPGFPEEYFRTGNYTNYLAREGSIHRMAMEISDFLRGFSGMRNKTALDFGCGPGFFVNGLRACGWRAFGYDTSLWAVRYAGSEFVERDLAAPGFPADYDVTFALDSLEHLETEEINQVLAGFKTQYLWVRIPVCGAEGGPFLLSTAEQDKTHLQRHPKLRWIDWFRSRGFSEMCRPSLYTIWDSPGVLVSLLRKAQ